MNQDPLVKMMLSVINRQSSLLDEFARAYRSTEKYTEEKLPSAFEAMRSEFYEELGFLEELATILNTVLEDSP